MDRHLTPDEIKTLRHCVDIACSVLKDDKSRIVNPYLKEIFADYLKASENLREVLLDNVASITLVIH